MTVDKRLIEAFEEDLREAWHKTQKVESIKTIYAFGLLTLDDGERLTPFACGERGLAKVATEYVKNKHYKTKKEAIDGLRWSVGDSPYEYISTRERAEAILNERDDPFDMPETKYVREIRLRLNAGCQALKNLDKEGLFGKGLQRESIILMIYDGENSVDLTLHWTKKLNSRIAYDAFASLFVTPIESTITQYGTKKCLTSRLSCNADRSLLAVTGDYFAFIFDTATPIQTFVRQLPNKNSLSTLDAACLSADGKKLGVVTSPDRGKSTLSILTGPKWNNVEHHGLIDKEPLYVVACPNGDWYALANTQNHISIYNDKGELLAKLEGHRDWTRRIAVSPDGLRLASVDERAGLYLWDTSSWTVVLHVPNIQANAVTFSNCGDRLAIHTMWKQHPLFIAEAVTGKITKSHDLQRDIQVAVFSPDDSLLAVGMRGLETSETIKPDEVALIDTDSGNILATQTGTHESIDDLEFIPNQNAIALAGTPEHQSLKALTMWVLPESY
ncbi:MAG: DUF4303 domain-containing protein [Planctomycetota bacterium]